jgi:hypothetical protein
MQATSGTMCYAAMQVNVMSVALSVLSLDTYIDNPLKKEKNKEVALKKDKKNS